MGHPSACHISVHSAAGLKVHWVCASVPSLWKLPHFWSCGQGLTAGSRSGENVFADVCSISNFTVADSCPPPTPDVTCEWWEEKSKAL